LLGWDARACLAHYAGIGAASDHAQFEHCAGDDVVILGGDVEKVERLRQKGGIWNLLQGKIYRNLDFSGHNF